MIRLFSYKLTTDSGFAPNPFWGVLTLATCKPGIRRSKRKNDWIAGFTSKELCGDPVGQERLVYLMQVEEKLTLAAYFHDSRFREKIPDLGAQDPRCWVGDNMYAPKRGAGGGFRQLPGMHGRNDKERDLSGAFVLVAGTHFYFGRDALVVPDELRPSVPPGQHPDGWLTHDERLAGRFIAFVEAQWTRRGESGTPHSLPEQPPAKGKSCG